MIEVSNIYQEQFRADAGRWDKDISYALNAVELGTRHIVDLLNMVDHMMFEEDLSYDQQLASIKAVIGMVAAAQEPLGAIARYCEAAEIRREHDMCDGAKTDAATDARVIALHDHPVSFLNDDLQSAVDHVDTLLSLIDQQTGGCTSEISKMQSISILVGHAQAKIAEAKRVGDAMMNSLVVDQEAHREPERAH